MTDPQSSKSQPQPPGPQAKDLAAPALILSAGLAEISAEAEERDRAAADAPRNPSVSGAAPRARNPVVRRRRELARLRGGIAASGLAPVIANPTVLVGASDEVEDVSRSDTRA